MAGVAEALPFEDGAFDAAMAVLTLHHWSDWRAGCAELRRVARRAVLLSWDATYTDAIWLTEYFRDVIEDDHRSFPSLDEQASALGAERVEAVPIPHDCTDGFLAAWWRRPEAYLDPVVRAGISTLAKRNPADLADGLARLRSDLDSDEWHRRHSDLLARDEIDLGYRLLVAGEG